MKILSLENMKVEVGAEIGVSDWLTITQDRVNNFAEVTEDRQYIHIDPVRAKDSPFGTTVAHGFLTLALVVEFSQSAGRLIEGCDTVINYGAEGLRFLAPVPVGAAVRGRFTLKDLVEKRSGQFLVTYSVTVEIDGSDKPAVVLDWLCMQIKN